MSDPTEQARPMDLGAMSISLAVKDLQQSLAFYEALGFSVFGGNPDQNWLMLRNGNHVIGLFQGMFEDNLMTFNPGWNQQAEETDSFTDIRALQSALQAAGIEPVQAADPTTSGPASLMLVDPDGNQILIDQHR